jgi:hypothetical protein
MRPIISLLSLCLLLSLASAVLAAPGVKTDFTSDASGNLQTRLLTPGNVGPVADGNAPPGFGIDQTVLWMTEDPTAIAQNVDITGNGQNIVAGWWLNNMRTSKYATQGTGSPIWDYPQTVNFFLPVSASDDGGIIASTGSQIPLSVWTGGAGPTPTWQYTYPANYQGVDCDVSDNGFYVAAICTRADTAAYGKLLVFNAASSALLWEVNFDAGPQANGVEISENNGWIAVGCYSNIYVYDLQTQTLFWTGPNYSQTMVGLDDDAEYLASGDFYGVLHLYRRIGSNYIEQWTNTLGGWVTAVDISSNASTVLAGNYSYSPANAGLVRGFNITGTVLWTYNRYGDYVADVALCNNGTVGVAGSWGQYGATYGDVFTAFSMSSGTVILRLLDDVDEPGSIFDVAISDNGAFAACGGKAVHARQFGNGGETYSLELVTVIQNVEVTLTPVNPPIIIPAGGGSFSYNITFTNTGPDTISFQGWIMMQLPNGRYFGPVLGPVGLTLAPGASITRMRTQSISGHAPAGTYNYIGYAGSYPSVIADSSYFPFAKSGSGDGNLESEAWPDIGESPTSENGTLITSALPNPFNPTTTIRFELGAASFMKLSVYDISGQLVSELANGWREAGAQEVTFDGSDLASGLYVYQLTAGEFQATGKMVLIR